MTDSLFHLCLQFKTNVCAELHHMPQISRETLKGDYLFVIDLPVNYENNDKEINNNNIHEMNQKQKIFFILLVDNKGAWSIFLKQKQSEKNRASSLPLLENYEIEMDKDCPFTLENNQVIDIIENSSRCKIQTDAKTLERLLLGHLKARVAFITQRVKISGDLPAFLKIISYLKTKGVKPYANTQDTA